MGHTVRDAALSSLITDERLKAGYDYWCRKAAGGSRLPRRADIDPTEIPHLLPHIRIVDVVEQGRFRYRLVGTETRQQHKSDPTGRYLDEVLSPPSGPRIIEVYAECVRDRRPIYVEHEFVQPNGRGIYRLSKALYTPLSEDGIAMNQVLVFHVLVAPSTPQPGLDLWAQPYRALVHAPL
jgi:hypothetical protein